VYAAVAGFVSITNIGQKTLGVKDFSSRNYIVDVGKTIKIKPDSLTYYVTYTDSHGTSTTISTISYPGDNSFAVYAGNDIPEAEFSLAISMNEI
jgi:hypothetical protein